MIKEVVFWRSVLCFNSVLYRLQLHRRWQQQQQQRIAAASLGAWMVDSSVVLKRESPETRQVSIEDSSFFLFFITHRASLSMTNASLRAAETTLYWLLSSAISKVM